MNGCGTLEIAQKSQRIFGLIKVAATVKDSREFLLPLQREAGRDF